MGKRGCAGRLGETRTLKPRTIRVRKQRARARQRGQRILLFWRSGEKKVRSGTSEYVKHVLVLPIIIRANHFTRVTREVVM